MRIATALLLLCMPVGAGGECISWTGSDSFHDIERASVVFEGVVESIEPGEVWTCAPERVVFTVDRVWKGEPAKKYVLFQDGRGFVTERMPDGREVSSTCPVDSHATVFTQAERYIVFASGPEDRLRSMGCSTSKAPAKDERRRLTRWKKSVTSGRKR